MLRAKSVVFQRLCQARNFSKLCSNSHPMIFSIDDRSKFIGKRHSASNVNTMELIYVAPLKTKIKILKCVTITTSILGTAAQAGILQRMDTTSLPIIVFMCTFVGIFTYLTPLLIHFITKKYVVEMYHDSADDSYVAVCYTLFVTKRYIRFKPEDVKIPEVERFFTEAFVKNIALFFDARHFNDLDHYRKIMGYDKPLNLFMANAEEIKK